MLKSTTGMADLIIFVGGEEEFAASNMKGRTFGIVQGQNTAKHIQEYYFAKHGTRWVLSEQVWLAVHFLSYSDLITAVRLQSVNHKSVHYKHAEMSILYPN